MRIELVELVIVLGEVGDDGPRVQLAHGHHVLGLQQGRDAQPGLGHREGQVTVIEPILGLQTIKAKMSLTVLKEVSLHSK